MARTSILSFGGYGDVTIHWESQNDDKVLPVIQSMIDRGVRFFVLSGKKKSMQRTEVTDPAATLSTRQIVIPDAELENLHQAGLITAGNVAVTEEEADDDLDSTGEIADTPEQVAENDTVAVAPAAGG